LSLYGAPVTLGVNVNKDTGERLATLYLLRHANAAAPASGETDFDRQLSDKGVLACQSVIQTIQAENIQPDLVLCSSSDRTRQTLSAIMGAWESPVPVEYLDAIYEAHPEEIRRAIAAYTAGNGSIMVIGHNPGLQMLTLALSNNQNGDAYQKTATGFPPGALAKLEVHPELWEDVEPGKFTYLKLSTP